MLGAYLAGLLMEAAAARIRQGCPQTHICSKIGSRRGTEIAVPEPNIGWLVGPTYEEWDADEERKLCVAAEAATRRFEEMTGRPWRYGRQEGDGDEVVMALVGAELAWADLLRYRRLRNDPQAQWEAWELELDVSSWNGMGFLSNHERDQARYWVERIVDLFSQFESGPPFPPSRFVAYAALREIIRHCSICPSCHSISIESNPLKEKKCETCRRWDRRLRPYLGLRSRRDFVALLRGQGGKCKICGVADPPVPEGALDGWHVDHDHATGKVRGILCPSCNAKVGKHEADRDARGAIEDYLSG